MIENNERYSMSVGIGDVYTISHYGIIHFLIACSLDVLL